jgi:hypothetical protein
MRRVDNTNIEGLDVMQRFDLPRSNGLWARIVPFIALGIFCILGVIGFIFLSYVILIGAAIGIVFFITNYVYSLLKRRGTMPPQAAEQHKGRTYEYKDL